MIETQRTVTFDDGAKTILETWGETGPSLVCVHGITSSRKSWTRLGQRLAGRYRVWAYDQRGHGDSASVEGPMSLDRCVADLRAVLEAVEGTLCGILGHSWGGAVVIRGGREIDGVPRVAAVDPMLYVAPGTWRQEFLDDIERDFSQPWPELERALRERHAGWHPLDVEGKLHAVRHMGAGAIERLGSDNRVDEGGWDLRGLVVGYPKPLLMLVAGPDDSVITARDLQAVRERGGSNVQVRIFPNEGHNLHRTAFAEFAQAVEDFLK